MFLCISDEKLWPEKRFIRNRLIFCSSKASIHGKIFIKPGLINKPEFSESKSRGRRCWKIRCRSERYVTQNEFSSGLPFDTDSVPVQ